MTRPPALTLPATSAVACIVFLWLRFNAEPRGPPDASGTPASPGLYTSYDLTLIIALFIWSIAKFAEEGEDRPLWPYALSILFCIYPLFVTVF